MKELVDQAVVCDNGEQTGNNIKPPVHQHLRHRLYHRHTTGQLTDQHRVNQKSLESVFSEKISNSNERNNNIQLEEGRIAIIPDLGNDHVPAFSNPTKLVNGHSPGSKKTQESHQRQSSPFFSGCRRRLYLHFNRALGGGAKPRWTSPSVDGSRKTKKHLFPRRKSANVNAVNAAAEEGPSSTSVLSDDGGISPPPRYVRSPSAGQIDYSNFASLQLLEETQREQEQSPVRDEHRLIAYNSSVLMAGTPAPLRQPYQIRPFENRNDHDVGSSCIDSVVTANDETLPAPSQISEPADAVVEERPLEQDGRYNSASALAAVNNETGARGSALQNDVGTPASTSNNLPQTTTDSAVASFTSEHEKGEGGSAASTATSTSAKVLQTFHKSHNRTCTSFRIKVPLLKNPVDACLLPDDCMAVADYDNGFFIVNAFGDLVQHKKTPHEQNACGVACSESLGRLFLLIVRDGVWSINSYNHNFSLLETARCPTDPQIENWALRRLVISLDTSIHLLASGENRSCIWTYEMDRREWRTVLVESSGRKSAGNYNDMSVRYDPNVKEARILLCEWKKAQLWTLTVNEKGGVLEQKSIKMKRVKGQEWIVQGPHLAVLDEQADIVVYDGSGKLFLFDGETYRCKKIIADVGRGEVSALVVANGWVYALCRYRLCCEAYLYREQNETDL